MNSKGSKNTSRTNWEALASMNDKDIDYIDYSDIPPLTDEFFEKATLRIPAQQAKQFVRIDPEILQWFQSQSQDYHTLINSILRHHMESHDQTRRS
jgi:uncharacterized protein (DUF4415 family)